MKYKKVIIAVAAVLFFLAALTFYLNRVILPGLVKNIVVERLEEVLKRRVEMGSLHFNWVRGFIIDKIKIYEKGPDQTVFAQAEQVTFGVLFFPGVKHFRITIPFIDVSSPSVHIVHFQPDLWNFSDMFTSQQAAPLAAAPAASTPAENKSPKFEIAWGGLTINNGKLQVDDVSTPHPWSEYFDNINLKLSLSYKGISYDFAADIPQKNGFLGATVYYQPITKNTEAHIRLRNINAASYFSLANEPDVHLDSGIIQDINLNINHTQEETSAQGDVLMKNLDISSGQQSFKGNIEIRGLDAHYRDGDITARGQMAMDHVLTQVPGLSTGGSVQARVDNFILTKEAMSLSGWLHAQHIFADLDDRRIQALGAGLDNIRIKEDKNGVQSTGSLTTQGLFVQWPDQSLHGDISLKNVVMRMKDENDIRLQGGLVADDLSTDLKGKTFFSKHLVLDDAECQVLDQKNIGLEGKLALDEMALAVPHLQASGSLKTDRLLFNLYDGTVKVYTTLDVSGGKFILDRYKTIEADPQLELNLQIPLTNTQPLEYKGSVTFSDGRLQGFTPFPSLDHVDLDADFQNGLVTINALNVNLLDTNLHVTGTVQDFKRPVLDILAEADELDLSQLKDLWPPIVGQYGLVFDGTSFVKVKFQGLASDPLAGKVLAVASVKNAGVYSSKLHQRIKNITGIVEATRDSLKWRQVTAVYQGQKYALAGSLINFRAPRISATLSGPGLELKADLTKRHDLLTINALTGKYLNADVESKGTVLFEPGEPPYFHINTELAFLLEDIVKALPPAQRKGLGPLNPSGMISVSSELKGSGTDWKAFDLDAAVTSPTVTVAGYHLNDMKIDLHQDQGRIKDSSFDGTLYNGKVHAVGSMDLLSKGTPYDLALNIDGTDLHQLKLDSPLKMQEIDGKFYLTSVAHGTVADFRNNLQAGGSLAIRDGFLGEFNLFKGLLSSLNDVLRLGQIEITDVEGNFTVADQKISTDNLRLKGPTIVLLSKGWVGFDQMCDLDVTVDLSSGVVPAIAHDVLQTLNIRIYDKISDPKFKRKISVPQVINSLLKNIWQ